MGKQNGNRMGGSYWVSTLSISLVLVVLGMLVFILLNAQRVSDHVKQNIGFSVVVNDGVSEAEIKKMHKLLDTEEFVYSSTYMSKEEAAKSYEMELGEDFVDILGYNPLLPSIEIKLNPKYANTDSLAMIETRLLQNEQVYEVLYQKSLVELVNNNVQRITLLLLGASLILVIISFTLIRNTIHLTVYSRRFLIKTMQLVGATSFFICRPFIRDGFWYGVLAALLANALLMGILYVVQQEFGSILYILHRDVILQMVGFVVVFGALLSMFSAWLSARSYIRRDIDELYN